MTDAEVTIAHLVTSKSDQIAAHLFTYGNCLIINESHPDDPTPKLTIRHPESYAVTPTSEREIQKDSDVTFVPLEGGTMWGMSFMHEGQRWGFKMSPEVAEELNAAYVRARFQHDMSQVQPMTPIDPHGHPIMATEPLRGRASEAVPAQPDDATVKEFFEIIDSIEQRNRALAIGWAVRSLTTAKLMYAPDADLVIERAKRFYEWVENGA